VNYSAVVLHEPRRIEAYDLHQEVVSGADVSVWEYRDRVKKIDRHRRSVEQTPRV
jgi:hypothetical protein